MTNLEENQAKKQIVFDPSQGPQAANPYLQDNFLPIGQESQINNPQIEGKVPKDLNGVYFRNGVNNRMNPPTGIMHMFDGDSMLHVVRFENEKVLYYSSSFITSKRSKINMEQGSDQFTTVGDLISANKEYLLPKLKQLGVKQEQGIIPKLALNEIQNPTTSTLNIGKAGKLYACVETSPPFQISIDPETGKVESGTFDDFDGQIPVFTAHQKIDPQTDDVHFIGKNAPGQTQFTYGVLSGENGQNIKNVKIPVVGYTASFMHDYYLTKNFTVWPDVSLRFDRQRMFEGKSVYFFQNDRTLKWGVIPRNIQDQSEVKYYDTQKPGFIWHVANGWEETENVIVIFAPKFDDYPDNIPIHLPQEPDSYLFKWTINTQTNEVTEQKCNCPYAVERLDFNRNYLGKKSKYIYLMKRSENAEMYDGFVKYNTETDSCENVVQYPHNRLGGECLFVSKENPTKEDDGYLIDIIYDPRTQKSDVCVWDASDLTSSEPITRVILDIRVPFGVHANFMTTQELISQKSWFNKNSSQL